jgi:hypothetical protein
MFESFEYVVHVAARKNYKMSLNPRRKLLDTVLQRQMWKSMQQILQDEQARFQEAQSQCIGHEDSGISSEEDDLAISTAVNLVLAEQLEADQGYAPMCEDPSDDSLVISTIPSGLAKEGPPIDATCAPVISTFNEEPTFSSPPRVNGGVDYYKRVFDDDADQGYFSPIKRQASQEGPISSAGGDGCSAGLVAPSSETIRDLSASHHLPPGFRRDCSWRGDGGRCQTFNLFGARTIMGGAGIIVH